MDVQTKTLGELMEIARGILKDRNALARTAKSADDLEQALKQQYSDFSLEFPTVFGSIVH